MTWTEGWRGRLALPVLGAAVTLALAFFWQGARPASAALALAGAALGLCVLLLWRAVRPLVEPPARREAQARGGRRRRELEREKQALLKAIKELEFDHQMRKISEADYREFRERFYARALRVLRQLDEGTAYRELIEREVAQRLAAQARRPVCGSCATVNDEDARFCKQCGKSLQGYS